MQHSSVKQFQVLGTEKEILRRVEDSKRKNDDGDIITDYRSQ